MLKKRRKTSLKSAIGESFQTPELMDFFKSVTSCVARILIHAHSNEPSVLEISLPSRSSMGLFVFLIA